ncbi:uncharacterized protein C8A04DRAFT_33968 [Dichotomopilus funicola]|uniref:Phosphatidylinositol-specific phospholipase C X domain-containing protein n=1 Tax=Dichotomopilus funicola TaxID=1934379 RepID=A0AAN6VBH4_9PEZI|nr:hypothetical protein C8A04DRAFT_33968 [Dichotomopilus funicola]
MGFVFSRPAAAAALPIALPTLIIRNLTITPLELKLVERLEPHAHHHPHGTRSLVKVSSQPDDRQEQSHEPEAPLPSAPSDNEHVPAKHELTGVTIAPFSECHSPVYTPDPAHHEQLRLTFEDTSTGHRYHAEIPALSKRSIVLKPDPENEEGETKEFTAVYLPQHAYLALMSSANLSSWMSTLDPSLPLSSLSIPGTHNSPTCYVALPSVRCQAVSVLDQLNNGVRFLDVRVSCPPYNPPSPTTKHTDNETKATASSPAKPELSLVHSAFPISLTGPKYLSTLLATVHDFLAANPSETILLSLKREGTGRGTDADLSRILHAHYTTTTTHDANTDTSTGTTTKWYTSPKIPTLAQCRGRIVLVRRFVLAPTVPSTSGGIDGSVWPDNVADGTCGSGTIRIQDYYGVRSGREIPNKVRFAQEGLERAAQGVHVRVAKGNLPDGGPSSKMLPLYINFFSASNFFNASCWPDRIAVRINPSMIEYLCMGHGVPKKGAGELDIIGDAATGIVVTDWVGHHGDWDLVRCIVGWNARLQLRQ